MATEPTDDPGSLGPGELSEPGALPTGFGFGPFGTLLLNPFRSGKWSEFGRFQITGGDGWPPRLPFKGIVGGAFGKYSRFAYLGELPREQWGATEWADYAAFLEEKGREMREDLIDAEREISDLRRKLTRRRIGAAVRPVPRGLLYGPLSGPPRKKPGRRPGSVAQDIAIEALDIQAQSRRRLTDKEAAEEALVRRGMGRYRVQERRVILNYMSRRRRDTKSKGSQN